MPTAAKFASSVGFALVAFLAASAFRPILPQAVAAIWFSPACAVIGALCGWFVMGRAAGHGYILATGAGLRTGVIMVFWVAFAFATRAMVIKSLRKMYHGATEAVLDIIPLMLNYGKHMLTPDVIGILVVGSMLAGILAEWTVRRWS